MAGGECTRWRATQAEADLFARLDEAFAHQQRLDPELLASVRTWQATDRSYEAIQQVTRGSRTGGLTIREVRWAMTMTAHLDAAIASGTTPFAVVVYRGLRDPRRVLGVDHPRDALGRRFRLSGYTATTISRRVAVQEFVGKRGLLLEVAVPAGTPALWVARIGDRALRRQGELLLGDGVHLHAYSLSRHGSIPVLSGKVMVDD